MPATAFPADVTCTVEVGSQRGDPDRSLEDDVNSHLLLGWRIINTYVEGKGPDSTREELVVLLGWSALNAPIYP